MSKITVVGAGAWGTALALSCVRAGHDVTLITETEEHTKEFIEKGENSIFLPGIPLPPKMKLTWKKEKLSETELVLMVVPAQITRLVLKDIKPHLSSSTPVMICSKGIEQKKKPEGENCLLSEVVETELPDQPYAILSGPNFAIEVAKNLPSATTIASKDIELAKKICAMMRHKHYRCYASDDVVGVQVCGAVKNVMAIACGIAHGKQMGNNATAALITRGLAEITRMGKAMGAKKTTFLGLSAMGDLLLTCSSEKSRNMSFGKAIAEGQNIEEFLKNRRAITEGYYTTQAVHDLKEKLGVKMPISDTMYKVLYESMPIEDGIEELLTQHSELEFEA